MVEKKVSKTTKKKTTATKKKVAAAPNKAHKNQIKKQIKLTKIRLKNK